MLHVDALSKTFAPGAHLRPLSFRLAPREIVFLLGPSGAGKTTALRCIANLEPFDAGAVTVDARSPRAVGFARWRRLVMYVPQHRVALRGTPAELFARALRFRARERAARRDAPRRVDDFVALCASMGLTASNVRRQQWAELSAGQAQRATVAMCLALRPNVLLLDEPSSNCDPQSTLQMEHAIKRSGIAAVWVSHDAAQPQRVGGRVLHMLPRSPPPRPDAV